VLLRKLTNDDDDVVVVVVVWVMVMNSCDLYFVRKF